MKRYFYTLPLLAATLTMSSCFKEEPLNSECDITHVSLHTDNPLATFYQLSDTAQNVLSTDSLISFEVRRDHEADLSLLTPTLQLTPGAKAVMTGSEVDNATGGKWYYQVVSEDGHWQVMSTTFCFWSRMFFTMSDTPSSFWARLLSPRSPMPCRKTRIAGLPGCSLL